MLRIIASFRDNKIHTTIEIRVIHILLIVAFVACL